MTDVEFRLATPDDDQGIRTLLARSYNDNVKANAPYTRWQYWTNPFGATVAVVGVARDQVVAHWAAVRVPLRIGSAAMPGAKGVDIATDPDWRGRGLFGRTATHLMAACSDTGLAAVLSHPNPHSAHGVERAGGMPPGLVAAYVRPLDDDWVAQRFRLPGAAASTLGSRLRRLPTGDPAQIVPHVPSDLDRLWAESEPSVSHGVIRDAAWWQWRYVDRPSAPYTFVVTRRRGALTGAAALTIADRFGGQFGLVLEFLATDEQAAAGLTAGLSEAASSRGAVGLAQVALRSSRVGQLAAASGFTRVPKPLEPRPLRFYVTAPNGDSAALARQPWTMQWGDLDHL